MASAEIPNRSLFKAPEVCEIAQLQLYVLRSWEAEFPDLGVVRAGMAGRVYRRHDLERVLRLKHLLFVEGLTLAGARRRLDEESTALPPFEEREAPAPAAAARPSSASADPALRRQLISVQHGLRSILALLDNGRAGEAQPSFQLRGEPPPDRQTPALKKAAGGARSARSSASRRRSR